LLRRLVDKQKQKQKKKNEKTKENEQKKKKRTLSRNIIIENTIHSIIVLLRCKEEIL